MVDARALEPFDLNGPVLSEPRGFVVRPSAAGGFEACAAALSRLLTRGTGAGHDVRGTSLSSSKERLVARLDVVPTGLVNGPPGQRDRAAVHFLETVSQHRSVDLVENVLAHLDDVVGPQADDLVVEGGVMDLAQREAVGDHRCTTERVGDDVGRIQEFDVLQLTHRAGVPVRAQHVDAERRLVEALLGEAAVVAPLGHRDGRGVEVGT
jgi:hypothetical protein